jgi:hypothetical protein
MSTQASSPLPAEASSRFVYDFLAYPPSPRTRRRIEPQPPTPTVRATVRSVSRRRSSTISAISWTTQILPCSHAFASVNPPVPSPVSRRPSQFRSPRSGRRHSATVLSYLPTPTHSHSHAADLRTPDYTSAVVPLPITPHTTSPRLPPSFFPSNRDNNHHTDMKFTLVTPREHEGAMSVHASPFPPTPAKKRGLIRFLRPGLRPRAATKTPTQRYVARDVQLPSSSPPLSPTTTAAFRIAHQKRVYYTRNGALPLPLEAEVELMQFADGGSRADAIGRLGAAAYTDAAGVVYADETEAVECFPLLLAPEDNADYNNHSAVPPSAPSTRALHHSIPVRAGAADAAAYLHLAFDPSSVSPARGGARRRKPAPLTLVPAAIGFDDSFVPSYSRSDASAVRDAKMEFRGLRDTRRE